jgi:poly(A) polymerase Pap1
LVKMEILLQIETENYSKVRELLLKDDLVSRASLTFKEAKAFDKEGYLCYIVGTEDQCKKALEITQKLAKEIKNKEEIINKIKEEDKEAIEGFGGIFQS